LVPTPISEELHVSAARHGSYAFIGEADDSIDVDVDETVVVMVVAVVVVVKLSSRVTLVKNEVSVTVVRVVVVVKATSDMTVVDGISKVVVVRVEVVFTHGFVIYFVCAVVRFDISRKRVENVETYLSRSLDHRDSFSGNKTSAGAGNPSIGITRQVSRSRWACPAYLKAALFGYTCRRSFV
jgi:hypothetical protein